jgi:hypothetical protein
MRISLICGIVVALGLDGCSRSTYEPIGARKAYERERPFVQPYNPYIRPRNFPQSSPLSPVSKKPHPIIPNSTPVRPAKLPSKDWVVDETFVPEDEPVGRWDRTPLASAISDNTRFRFLAGVPGPVERQLNALAETGLEITPGNPTDTWEKYGGPLLMHAADQKLDQQPLLVILVFRMIALFELYTAFVTGSFLNEIRLGGFCRKNGKKIQNILRENHATEWNARARMTNSFSVVNKLSVVQNFAADLPKKCPGVFWNNHEMQAIAVAHRLSRHSLLVDMGNDYRQIQLFDVPRQRAFVESMPELINVDPNELRRGIGYIRFENENGVGIGPTRDWYSTVARQSVSPEVGLFAVRSELPAWTKIREDIDIDELSRMRDLARGMGRFMGVALVDGFSLGYDFPVMFYAKLMNAQLTLDDIEEYEPGLFAALKYVLEAESIEDVGVDEIEIGGVMFNITIANRGELVMKKLNDFIPVEAMPIMDAIKTGFSDIVPPDVLSDVDVEAVRSIFQGNTGIDFKDLKQVIDYGPPYSATHKVIVWFYDILEEFDQEMRSKFLFFFSSSAYLPLGGFKALGARFYIQSDSDFKRLPSSRTCAYTLILPQYRTKEELRTKLVLAVEAAQEGMYLA